MIADIRETVWMLLNTVERPPDTALPPGADSAALDEFEAATGIQLPPEVREWLQTCNAPCVGPGGLYGVAPAAPYLSMAAQLDLHPEWRALGWLPFAGDGMGNEYVMDLRCRSKNGHPIYFVDHEVSMTEPGYVVASGAWQFLRFLLQRELDDMATRTRRWPFQKDYVLAEDPELAIIQTEASLPWEEVDDA